MQDQPLFREGGRSVRVPESEYAAIAHQIATYPEKADRGFVFTANNFYLCTEIDEEGSFKIDVALPIEGNEDLINKIRGDRKENVIPVYQTSEGLASIADELRNGRGRNRRNNAGNKRQRGGTGRDVSLPL